jgi:hypothetical protein
MTGVDPLLVAGGVWLWESYGKDAFSWLVKHLGKRAEDVKTAGWEKIDWALASRRYREELGRLYGTMHIFGMSQSVPLSDIFTDVYLLDKPIAWRRYAIEELQARGLAQYENQLRQERHDGITLVQTQKRLYILGQPGAGKTTFLKYLVIQAVAKKLEVIPIFVSLKEWSDSNIDLFPFLVRQFTICSFPDAQPFIEQLLEDGKAMVLFDGLDEVNLKGGAHARITDAIRDFARQYRKSRIVITCRTAATEYVFEGFNYCELTEFTREQMEAFVGRWFQANEIKRQAFWNAFSQPEHEGLRDLARRPLLLTMLCLTFEETMAFPRRRAELYEEAIDALLKKWDSSRSIQRDTIYSKLSLGYKRQLLMEIAAKTFERDELFLRKRDIVEHVIMFLRRLPPVDNSEDIDGEVVLRSIEAQHGLLIERAQHIYSFSHLTFQEYFTARYIAEHPELAVLRGVASHAADPRWREVLLLTVSMLDYRNVARLFGCWCKQLEHDALAHKELEVFIRVADDQLAAAGHLRNIQARAAVMLVALLNWASIQAASLTHNFTRAGALAHNFIYDRDLTRARARARALASALANTMGDARAGARASVLANELANDLASTLASVRTTNIDLVNNLVCNHRLILNIALALVRASELNRIYVVAQHMQANEMLDATHTLSSQAIHAEHVSPALLDPLGGYLASTRCLLDCLGVAVVENRGAILNHLLCLPDQPITVAALQRKKPSRKKGII